MKENNLPDKNCLNCQFLCSYHRQGYDEMNFHVDKSVRQRIMQAESVDDVEFFHSGYRSLKCYHKVWDQNMSGFKNEGIFNEELVKDRDDFCFWLRHRGNMGFPAAVKLQEKEDEKQDFKKEINLTRTSLDYAKYGIWVTAAVGAGSLLIELYKLLFIPAG